METLIEYTSQEHTIVSPDMSSAYHAVQEERAKESCIDRFYASFISRVFRMGFEKVLARRVYVKKSISLEEYICTKRTTLNLLKLG